jgi:folate-dependent phosphoribosylglycinamide formyltransferase PurN
MADTPRPLPEQPLGHPIRVVLFGGAFFEPMALRFVAMLEEHPEIELVAGFCQSRGFGLRHRLADVLRRRKALAPAVLAADAFRSATDLLRHPLSEHRRRARAAVAMQRIRAVPDIHATEVLDQVRMASPDLGLVYGAPRLRPELFEIPAFGTLGIHHGKLPHYRGKKTTFWAMFNGDATAGVGIQRIGPGLDTGELVCAGEVDIERKRYGQVDAEVQELGLRLFVDAIVGVKRGAARSRPQPTGSARLYRQPHTRHVLRLWCRQLTGRRHHA